MRCKGKYPGDSDDLKGWSELVEFVTDSLCGSNDWEEVWSRAFKTDEFHYTLYQCRVCKRIVAAADDTASSDNWM